ncbi:uncharacterized protein ACA1_187610 [Acanthamoeba castellanii str. Neff]|uniref:Interferon-related developmental regulator N-terminal domain-containing protein n=1 Tax=Acanthamoeba castellanii (strain ATCC 30010 / Neff) TaxID=1257118 RepID=L8GRQ2_ACACF|nr:uncharacterized protein ACA1_187610 [Acanthamoeba castellanii str. Neff]ELR15864.1 hypothetical protein ACA1_187610 [Acanthamoeba castellanii str. Neff]
MERARRRLARNGGLDEVGVLQASRLQEELTRREVRRASEAVAAAKKNARLRLKREQKAAQRREELQQAYRREYDRGAVYLPPVLEPPKPPAPTEQEVGEEWRAAREEVAGLLPADWGSDHADRVQWCLGWLAHTDKRRRMSALHSLHAFLSPAVDAEFGVELCVEERLLAVMVAGLVLLWSKESCAIVREKLLDVLARHTLVGGTDDDDGDGQAEPERVGGHHDVVNSDDLRAAAVDVLGVLHFLHYYGTDLAEGAGGDGDDEDPVIELIDTTFTRLCADDRTPAIVRATALSVIGLLGTLLPAPYLASWLDTNVELVLGFLRHDDISMRLAGADALLVFLAAIHDDLAFVVDDDADADDEAGVEAELLSAVPGQHELFQLRSRLEEMVKARDRRASKADNKSLRSLVERLLQLLHALARQTDQLKARNADRGDDDDDEDEDDDGNDDDDDDDDEEEEEEEYVVERESPRLQVTLRLMGSNKWNPGVQPELAVYSERHRKQLEAVMALTGPSLRLNTVSRGVVGPDPRTWVCHR